MTNDATDEASSWAWIAPDGTLVSGDEWDLVGALRAAELPPDTLVWRRTWVSWLPVARVAELASALQPDAVEAPEDPVISATALTPPSRPPGASPEPSGVRVPRSALSPGEAADPPSSLGLVGRPRGVSILGPPRETSGGPRPSMATLGADDSPMARPTTTLRPPGAVPPPPRTAPAAGWSRVIRADSVDSAPATRRTAALGTQRDTLPGTGTDASEPLPAASVTPASSLRPSELPTPVVLPGAPGAVAIHSKRPGAPVMLPPPRAPTPFSSDSSTNPVEISAANLTLEVNDPAEFRNTIPDDRPPHARSFSPAPDSVPPRRSSLPVPRSMVLGLVALAGVTALLAGGMVALVLSRTDAEKRPVPTPASAKPPPPVPKEVGCRALQPAARLASSVHRAVPPLLAAITQAERVAVGFAATPKSAAGLIVTLPTLDAEQAFEQNGEQALFGSVPLMNAGTATFVVDRAGGPIGGARTVTPELVLGTSGGDFVRSAGNATLPLWPGAASEKTTDPRVASTPSGHLVTFRRGGLGGRILYGWLDPSGKPDADLASVNAPNVSLAGTPDAAARAEDGLLVFAGRPSADAEWRVQLVTTPRRGAPSVRTFETAATDGSKGSIAPSATPLADGGWVLQWTEGSTGHYQVHLQRLTAKLDPLGEARLVSPKGANSGQGALIATGARVLSVFVQTTAGHDELWGASFECP